MTRVKKSRKSGPLAKRKVPKEQQNRIPVDPKAKKHKGKKPGSRNAPLVEKKQEQATTGVKDKRHGSSKPIPLIVEAPVQLNTTAPKAKLQKAAEQPELTPEQELMQIENDEKLLDLIARVEEDEVLQGKEAKYFNKMMARHHALSEQLGLLEEEESDDPLANFESLGWEDELRDQD